MMAVIGIPFRWKKFRGGTEINWIGYWIDVRAFRLGISEKRAAWLANWLRVQVEAGRVDMQDLEAVLGRLCFAVAPLEFLRPFLAPIYAWMAAIGHRGNMALPWAIRFLFVYLAGKIEGDGRTTVVRPIGHSLGTAFRADAKAEGQEVVVGGWECLGGTREMVLAEAGPADGPLGLRPGRAFSVDCGSGALRHPAHLCGFLAAVADIIPRVDRPHRPH